MPKARIKTDFGDIRITYNDMDDLNAALQGLEEQAKTISQAVGNLIPASPRLPKPGYEKAYRFSPTGKVELLVFPQKTLVQLAVFALFAYYPDTVSATELEQVTGIDDIVAKTLGQTMNKKYFLKIGDTFGLSTEGHALFREKVKPIIDAASTSDQLTKGDEE